MEQTPGTSTATDSAPAAAQHVMWDPRAPAGAVVLPSDSPPNEELPVAKPAVLPLKALTQEHLDVLAMLFTATKILFVCGGLPALPALIEAVGTCAGR